MEDAVLNNKTNDEDEEDEDEEAVDMEAFEESGMLDDGQVNAVLFELFFVIASILRRFLMWNHLNSCQKVWELMMILYILAHMICISLTINIIKLLAYG